MTRVFLLLLLTVSLLVAAHPAAGQDTTPVARMTARVQTLTAPELAGRGSGTPATAATAELLVEWMEQSGLQPAFAGGWLQEFDLTGTGWLGQELAGHTSLNVAGTLAGHGDLANRWVIIGAHHDHLGLLAAQDPTAVPAPGAFYAGANDNASGVVVVSEIMERLSHLESEAHRRSLLVVFFGAEEVGLQGSSYFVNHAPLALDQVDLMINYDTVGQVSDNTLYVSGVGTAANLREMARTAGDGGLTLSLAEGGWSGSDHMVFNTREVPVLFVFGGPYRQYNTPADTWETLNYSGLEAVADYGFRLAVQAVTRPENSTWIMVAQPELRDDDGPQNRSSWLGTLPDFTEEMAGYKLAGVFDGSPAAEAGLLKGDVLITLAGHEVTDLPTFTRALRANNPGDLVEITLLRDGSPLNFTVVLGDRKDRK
jgi:hypothetical protein|nr:M28 family peptidase [Candidatus Krumholzibacteria bacterium]